MRQITLRASSVYVKTDGNPLHYQLWTISHAGDCSLQGSYLLCPMIHGELLRLNPPEGQPFNKVEPHGSMGSGKFFVWDMREGEAIRVEISTSDSGRVLPGFINEPSAVITGYPDPDTYVAQRVLRTDRVFVALKDTKLTLVELVGAKHGVFKV